MKAYAMSGQRSHRFIRGRIYLSFTTLNLGWLTFLLTVLVDTSRSFQGMRDAA